MTLRCKKLWAAYRKRSFSIDCVDSLCLPTELPFAPVKLSEQDFQVYGHHLLVQRILECGGICNWWVNSGRWITQPQRWKWWDFLCTNKFDLFSFLLDENCLAWVVLFCSESACKTVSSVTTRLILSWKIRDGTANVSTFFTSLLTWPWWRKICIVA